MADYGFYLNRLLTKRSAQATGIRPNYIYGLLYNWWAANDSRIGNSGFTVPTYDDYFTLNYYINTNYNISPNNFGVGNHLKSCRQVSSPLGGDCATTVHPRWAISSEYGRNTLLMSFLPNGARRGTTGESAVIGVGHYGWYTISGRGIRLLYNSSTLDLNSSQSGDEKAGCSIRLSRLSTPSELLIPEGQIIPNYYKGNNDFLYDCVRINDRIWLAQNLAETKWSDGTLIPFAGANGINFSDAEWAALTTPGVCAYNNDTETWAYTLP